MKIPPVAKKVAYSYEIHNVVVNDEYQWLKGDGWPEKISNREILSYLDEENNYFDFFMSKLIDKKNMVFEELKQRVQLTDQSVSLKRDNYYYYWRTEEDKDYIIYCRKFKSLKNKEEILLDVNKTAEEKKFTAIGAFAVSPNHKLVSYSTDFTGNESYTIRVFNLETKEFLDDYIANTIGNIIWHENGKGFFYTSLDGNLLQPMKVMFHKLGTQNSTDHLIFCEKDSLYSVSIKKSSSKKYIFIRVAGHDNNEYYYFPIKDRSFTPILVQKRSERIVYSVDHGYNYFYMYTNYNAKKFQVLRTDNIKKGWRIYIKESYNKYLSGFDLTQSFILLNYQCNGLPLVIIKNLNSGKIKQVEFPDESYTAYGYSTNFEYNDLRIEYSAPNRPNTIYKYHFNKAVISTLKAEKVPSGFDTDLYSTKRIFAESENVKVPVTVFYKKALLKKDGSNPLYLYGYGAYGHAVGTSFKSSAISLVDRGFVYAIAHIRGGDELGYEWYEEAKFLNKKKTFNDFIASAQKLIQEKYTTSGNIVISGSSAGGMLIGNVINEKPELFKAAITHVPFVDVLNTMLDEDLPLTISEFKEWGNPKEKDYFDYIKSYSPYENIKAQNYPHLMVTAGLNDPRVGYWEAAKWVAKLRSTKTDKNIIIFKTNMHLGHRGSSSRFELLREIAEDITFILTVFGL